MASEKTEGRRRSSDVIEHDSASRKASVFCSDSEFKFRCSFCPERFPSLVTVRDHTHNEHQRQNYQRKIERLRKLMKYKSFKVNKASSKSSHKTGGENRRTSVVIEHDSASKKARVSCSSELRFRCSFCSERFPSLLTVRDHTRNEHHMQNECRRIERLGGLTDSQKNTRLNKPKLGNKLIKDSNDDKTTSIYRCVACTFASVSYDLMIEHCQHHIIDEAPEDVIIKPITTIQTEVIGEKVDVDSHTFKEYNDNSNMNTFMFVDCDYELLKSDRWPGIFEMFNKHEIDKINYSSIYYFTRIIHFTSEEKTSSAPFMLYKCMKCMKYIDPHSLVAHVQENSCSELHKGFSCYECELLFLTENYMYLHYKTHKVTNANMNYMTISFNYNADKVINAILLKAAGRNMSETSENNDTVLQPPGTVQPPGGVNTTMQQGLGIPQQKGQVNSRLHQGPGNAQPLGGVNNTTQQRPGNAQPQRGVNNTTQQGPGIEHLARVNKPALQAPVIVQSQAGVKNTQTTKDARTMIIQGKNKTNELSEIADNIVKDKVVSVYKCQCDLCFHAMEPLFKHIESCTADLIINKITCLCSLVFDIQQYELHYNLHSRGVTKFNVKKVIICDEKAIASNQHEFKQKAGTKEDNKKILTKKDIVDTKTLKKRTKEVEKTIDEIRKKAISQLTTSILNLPSMLTCVGDLKFVKKHQITAVTGTHAVNLKSDDATDKSVDKSGGSVSMAVMQSVHNANKELEKNREAEAGDTNLIAQTDSNIAISDKAVGNQQLNTDENNIINSESGSTEENQSMVATTIEVELAEKSNTNMTKHGAHTKTLKCNNQETEAINTQSNHNECEEIIDESKNEDVLRDIECNTSQKNYVHEPEVKNVVAVNKIYTEDELLNEDELSNEDKSMYFDANSLLSDDEDPILR